MHCLPAVLKARYTVCFTQKNVYSMPKPADMGPEQGTQGGKYAENHRFLKS